MRIKKLLCFFSFLFISILAIFYLPTSVNAAWTKFSGNPVLSPGDTGDWDSQSVFGPAVLFDGTEYKMWYEGRKGSLQQIGLATSNDGVTWLRSLNNPLISPGTLDEWNEIDVTEPMVLFDSDESVYKYKMWYTSMCPPQPTGEEHFQVRYAVSEDGIKWKKHPAPVLQGEPDTWEAEGVSQPYVRKEGVTYKMWYAGRNRHGVWRIGYATSSDGVIWNKYVRNPVLEATESWEYITDRMPNVGRPSILFDKRKYYMFYHLGPNVPYDIAYAISEDGIHWIKPEDNPILTRGSSGDFDDVLIGTPYILKESGIYSLYYTGYDGSRWQIGYASMEEAPPPKPPLILLPGFGASWSYKKIFLGEEVPQSEWEMAPFVKDYDNFLTTLDAADFTTDEDLFVFNYDWTRPVDQIADDFKDYIDQVVDPPGGESSGKEVKLIGHSLGGLVARAYIQENPGTHQVEQLITLGSPHKGVVQAYKAWEGADFHDLIKEPLRLGGELLLALRGREYKNKVEAVRSTVPSLKDLLFIDDYLKKHPSGRIIPERTYSQRNLWLKNLGITDELKNLLDAVIGKIADTLRWLKVVPPPKLDKMLNRWQDGKPVGEEFEIGDKTVLVSSAGPNGIKTTEVSLNHSDLVRTKEGIETILSLLEMEGVSAIVNPYPPDSPFLVFALASPGNLRVTNPLDQKAGFDIFPPTIPHALFLAEEKMVVIPGAVDGDYKVEVVGDEEAGPYRLLIGQLTERGDVWKEYQGEIAPSETDTYTVGIDNTLETTPLDLSRLIKEKLKNLLIGTAKEHLSLRKKAQIEGKVTKILAEFEPVATLLEFKRIKEAGKLVEKALLDSLNLAAYLEKNGVISLSEPVREVIDYLDQLHQLLAL